MDVVILDARSADAYAAAHLPGAIHADLETQLSSASTNADPARGGRHPLPPLEQWLRQLEEWGITPSTRVIVYDDQQGANAAARVWWMLRAVGHENVEVLTRPAVILSEAKDPPRLTRRGSFASLRMTEDWQLPTVTLAEVDRLRRDPSWRVLDVRATPRFLGQTDPPAELRRMYEDLLGDVPPERLVVHCGSGVTACHTLLALELAGLHGASLYVGSWGEWCRNDMPLAVG